jgi:hypothetical protein
VATVLSTEAWDEPDQEPRLPGVEFAGQLTGFEVKGVLKGKLTERTLDLLHYKAAVTGEAIVPRVKVSYARAYVAEFPEPKASTEDDATKKGEGSATSITCSSSNGAATANSNRSGARSIPRVT